ncbi:MAG: PEP/pyruvate-binding domain-containing protein, partial [Candidatus Omnitrophota bacterium]|nr:PEP/pyruvate-binding domain-containing protein [Candidatus Omnitrophota bacterium]
LDNIGRDHIDELTAYIEKKVKLFAILLPLTEDSDWRVRLEAVKDIGAAGETEDNITMRLAELLADDSIAVRDAARETLVAIIEARLYAEMTADFNAGLTAWKQLHPGIEPTYLDTENILLNIFGTASNGLSWTEIYLDTIILKYVNNDKFHKLYLAVKELAAERAANRTIKLNIIADKYNLDGDNDYWIMLHKALYPGSGVTQRVTGAQKVSQLLTEITVSTDYAAQISKAAELDAAAQRPPERAELVQLLGEGITAELLTHIDIDALTFFEIVRSDIFRHKTESAKIYMRLKLLDRIKASVGNNEFYGYVKTYGFANLLSSAKYLTDNTRLTMDSKFRLDILPYMADEILAAGIDNITEDIGGRDIFGVDVLLPQEEMPPEHFAMLREWADALRTVNMNNSGAIETLFGITSKGDIEKMFEYVQNMIDAYVNMHDIFMRVRITDTSYNGEALKQKLAELKGSIDSALAQYPESRDIGSEPVVVNNRRLNLRADVRTYNITMEEIKSVHDLINYVHRKAAEEILYMRYLEDNDGTNVNDRVIDATNRLQSLLMDPNNADPNGKFRTIDSRFIDLRNESDRAREPVPAIVRLLAAEKQKNADKANHLGSWRYTVAADENESWTYLAGDGDVIVHVAELYVKLADPSNGGGIRLKWNENCETGKEYHQLRRNFMAKVLERIGFKIIPAITSLEIEAVYDKDNGALSLEDIRDKAAQAFRLIISAVDVDLAFRDMGLLKKNEEEQEAILDNIVAYFLTTGYTTEQGNKFNGFENSERYFAMLNEVLEPGITRGDKLRGIINDELERLNAAAGAPVFMPIPEDEIFGQTAVYKYFNEPIERELKSGRLVLDESGRPQANSAYQTGTPVRYFNEMLSDEANWLIFVQNAQIIQKIEDFLNFEAIGSIGGYYAEKTIVETARGSVTFYVLRDPTTRRIELAYCVDGTELASLDGATNVIRDYSEMGSVGNPELVISILASQGYRVSGLDLIDTVTSKKKTEIRQLLNDTFPPDVYIGKEASGYVVSKARRTGRIMFNDKERILSDYDGAVLVAEYTTPDDEVRMKNANGVITTSGNVLSHASIIARELGIAGLIPEQSTLKDTDGDGVPNEMYVVFTDAYTVKDTTGRQIAYKAGHAVKTLILREGDIVTVDGITGTLHVLGDIVETAPDSGIYTVNSARFTQALTYLTNIAMNMDRVQSFSLLKTLVQTTTDEEILKFVILELLVDRALKGDAEEGDIIRGILQAVTLNTNVSGGFIVDFTYDILRKMWDDARVASDRALADINTAHSYQETFSIIAEVYEQLDMVGDVEALLSGIALTGEPITDYEPIKANIFNAAENRMRLFRENVRNELIVAEAARDSFILDDLFRLRVLRQKADDMAISRDEYTLLSDKIDVLESEKSAKVAADSGKEIFWLKKPGDPAFKSEVDSDYSGLVGGKGAKTGDLATFEETRNALPSGFAVSKIVYERFIDETGLRDAIDHIISNNLLTDKEKSEEIKDLIASVEVPASIQEAIKSAYRELSGSNPDMAVAVRSSATLEDMPEASFAGMFSTELYITGEAAVIESVRNIWTSLWNERAISYAEEKGIDALSMAVVIQEMSDTGKSGIAFTVDAAGNKWDSGLINSGWGLGEGIVSGIEDADRYVVNLESGGVLPILSDKRKMVIANPGMTGTIIVDTPAELRNKRTLPDHQVLQVMAVAQKLALIYNSPVDIEFGYDENDDLVILQVRDITTLKVAKGRKFYEERYAQRLIIAGLTIPELIDGLRSGSVDNTQAVRELSGRDDNTINDIIEIVLSIPKVEDAAEVFVDALVSMFATDENLSSFGKFEDILVKLGARLETRDMLVTAMGLYTGTSKHSQHEIMASVITKAAAEAAYTALAKDVLINMAIAFRQAGELDEAAGELERLQRFCEISGRIGAGNLAAVLTATEAADVYNMLDAYKYREITLDAVPHTYMMAAMEALEVKYTFLKTKTTPDGETFTVSTMYGFAKHPDYDDAVLSAQLEEGENGISVAINGVYYIKDSAVVTNAPNSLDYRYRLLTTKWFTNDTKIGAAKRAAIADWWPEGVANAFELSDNVYAATGFRMIVLKQKDRQNPKTVATISYDISGNALTLHNFSVMAAYESIGIDRKLFAHLAGQYQNAAKVRFGSDIGERQALDPLREALGYVDFISDATDRGYYDILREDFGNTPQSIQKGENVDEATVLAAIDSISTRLIRSTDRSSFSEVVDNTINWVNDNLDPLIAGKITEKLRGALVYFVEVEEGAPGIVVEDEDTYSIALSKTRDMGEGMRDYVYISLKVMNDLIAQGKNLEAIALVLHEGAELAGYSHKVAEVYERLVCGRGEKTGGSKLDDEISAAIEIYLSTPANYTEQFAENLRAQYDLGLKMSGMSSTFSVVIPSEADEVVKILRFLGDPKSLFSFDEDFVNPYLLFKEKLGDLGALMKLIRITPAGTIEEHGDVRQAHGVVTEKLTPLDEALKGLLNAGDTQGAKDLLDRFVALYAEIIRRGFYNGDVYNTNFLAHFGVDKQGNIKVLDIGHFNEIPAANLSDRSPYLNEPHNRVFNQLLSWTSTYGSAAEELFNNYEANRLLSIDTTIAPQYEAVAMPEWESALVALGGIKGDI